jgi:ADP-heptose:LPS heptosyltransferase
MDVCGQSLAVIRCGALGDTVLLTPFLEVLRDHKPKVLDVVVDARWARLLAGFACLDGVFDPDAWQLWRVYGEESLVSADSPFPRRYDRILAFLRGDDSFRSRLEQWTGAAVHLLHPLPTDGKIHMVDHCFRSFFAPGTASPSPLRLPVYRHSLEDKEVAERFLTAEPPAGFWAIHAGSGSGKKNWPLDNFSQCARRLKDEGARIVLVLGPAERAEAENIVSAFAPLRPLLARDLPLPQLAAVLSGCRGFLGNDSGVTHLAGLLGLPGAAVFSVSDPALWSPWGGRLRTVTRRPGCGEVSTADVLTVLQSVLAESRYFCR